MKVWKIGLPILFATVIAVSSASAATCTLASLSGVSGLILVGQDAANQPYTGVGQVTSDGKGSLPNLTVAVSHNGVISPPATLTGTYSIAKNCIGTVTANVSTSTIVLDSGNKGWQLIGTSGTGSGQIRSGFLVPQGTVTCGLSGKSQTLSLNLTGTVVGTGEAAYIGQVTLNGKGSVTGTMTLNVNGTVHSGVAITGTYTEASTCLGTMQITPSGFSAMNFFTVVVDAGKQILMIETDNNTVVSGLMQ
jgi:hypothetical protein